MQFLDRVDNLSFLYKFLWILNGWNSIVFLIS